MKDKIKVINTKAQMATMVVFFVLWSLVLAVVDLFAFQNGATATISQCWLAINRNCWIATYVVAFWMGALLQHVSIARQPGTHEDPDFSATQGVLWSVAFIVGMYASYRWLYQLPDSD